MPDNSDSQPKNKSPKDNSITAITAKIKASKASANSQQTPAPAIAPILTSDESATLLKKAFSLIVQATPTLIDVDQIQNDFAQTKRKHTTKSNGPVEDLVTQVTALGFINSLIVLHDPNSKKDRKYILLTGSKRLKAAEKVGTQAWCRLIERTDLFNTPHSQSWGDAKQDILLKELAKNLTYSESAMVTSIGDSTLLDLFRQMRQSHDYKKFDFIRVMPRIGITRESAEYRNTKRIWDVTCCDPALKLFDEKRVKLNLLKKDNNLRPLEQPTKAAKIVARITRHTDLLRQKASEKEKNKAFTRLKSYSDFEIEKIISEEDMPGRTPLGSLQDGYRQPRFSVRFDDKHIQLPAATIDFSDRQPNNIRKIAETLYGLQHIAGQIESFLRAIQPLAAGDTINEHAAQQKPQRTGYEKSYVDFIEERNLHGYCNLEKIVEYYKDKSDPISKATKIEELKADADSIVAQFVKRTNDRRNVKKEEVNQSAKIIDMWARERANLIEEKLPLAAGSDLIAGTQSVDAFNSQQVATNIQNDQLSNLQSLDSSSSDDSEEG